MDKKTEEGVLEKLSNFLKLTNTVRDGIVTQNQVCGAWVLIASLCLKQVIFLCNFSLQKHNHYMIL